MLMCCCHHQQRAYEGSAQSIMWLNMVQRTCVCRDVHVGGQSASFPDCAWAAGYGVTDPGESGAMICLSQCIML